MRNFNPLVSVVIPVYNGANYLREAIDSALGQTYTNVEIIVVNDGSTDDGETDSIAVSYGDRIRYYKKENGGCASALNLGITKMKGEYFSWLSHDDVYYPDKVAHQIDILSSLSNKGTIIYGGWELIDANSKRMGQVNPHDAQPLNKLNISLFPLLRGLLHGCSMLVPVRYFKELGTFNENLPSTQDYELWFRFLRVAPIHYDAKILIQSRVHPEQGTHKISNHIEECNQLWCGFLAELTEDEMCVLEESPYRFLKATSKFLSNTPYQKAKSLADRMSVEVLSKTLVSIIVPFRNRIELLIEALESARLQNHKNIEIIVVDDGSSDSVSPVEDLANKDKRIKLIRISPSGPSRARNVGVASASGIYTAFLDSDDKFRPEKISTQLQYLESRSLYLSHTSYERVDELGNAKGIVHSGRFSGGVFPRIMVACPIATPTVMGLTRLFKSTPFPENFNLGEDVSLWIKLTMQYELGGIDEALTYVRVVSCSASNNAKKQIQGRLNIASYIVGDPELSKYGKQLRELLRVTRWLVPNVSERSRNCQGTEQPWRDWIIVKSFSYLRKHGLGSTLNRIKAVLSNKSIYED